MVELFFITSLRGKIAIIQSSKYDRIIINENLGKKFHRQTKLTLIGRGFWMLEIRKSYETWDLQTPFFMEKKLRADSAPSPPY